MGLRDLRAGTTAVIGDSCPASEIDILTADITEIISSKLAEGSNIESTIVQALQDILADSHTNVKNLFGDASSFGATTAGDDPSTPRSDHDDKSVDLGSITKAEQESLLECMQSPAGTDMAGRAAAIMAEITRRQCGERDVARAVRLSAAADARGMEPEPEDGAESDVNPTYAAERERLNRVNRTTAFTREQTRNADRKKSDDEMRKKYPGWIGLDADWDEDSS